MPDDADLLPIDAQAEFGPTFTMPVSEDPEPEPDPYQDIDTDLDPHVREDFVGMLYLGRLEETCVVAGHRFLLRTPSQDERLEMGPLHKPYLNTVSTEAAWRLITVAAYLRAIDSQLAPEPLNPGQSAMRLRVDWVRASIYADQVTELLFDQCLLLDARVRETIEALDGQGKS